MSQEKPQRRWYQFSLRTMLIAVGVFAVCMAAIAYVAIPRIDVVPVIENGQVVFNIPFSGINGLLRFEVMDGAKPLWIARIPNEKGHKIVYGTLPTGGNWEPTQEFPPPGKMIPNIRGKTVTVTIEYQFDRGISACQGSFTKIVDIP